MTSELLEECRTHFGTYFGELVYLNTSCVGKNIILMFLSSSRGKFVVKRSDSCFCQFPAAMLVGVGSSGDGPDIG